MSKFLSMTLLLLSASVAFGPYSAEAGRGKHNGKVVDREGDTKTRLQVKVAAREARDLAEKAPNKSSWDLISERELRFLPPDFSGPQFGALNKKYRSLTSGPWVDLNTTEIRQPIASLRDTVAEEIRQVATGIEDPKSGEISGILFPLTGKLKDELIRRAQTLKEDADRILIELSDENMSNMLLSPASLIMTLCRNIADLETDLNKLNDSTNKGFELSPNFDLISKHGDLKPLEILQYLVFVNEPVFETISVYFSFQKAALPLLFALEHLMEEGDLRNQLISLTAIVRGNIAKYLLREREFRYIYDRFAKIIELRQQENSSYSDYLEWKKKQDKERKASLKPLTESFDAEFYAMRRAVQKAVTQWKAQEPQQPKKKNKNKKKMGTPSALLAEIRDRQTLRQLLEEEALAKASEPGPSSPQTPQRRNKENFANAEGYLDWYFISSVSTTKQAREAAAKEDARLKEKAQKKAEKPHEPADPLENEQAPTISPEVNDTPEKTYVYLSPRLFDDFQRIVGDPSKEFTMDEVANVIQGLGGYIDNRREGSRVRLAIRDLVTGHVHGCTIHNHLKFGHKGLDGGRMKSVRELIERAGYSLENVKLREREE